MVELMIARAECAKRATRIKNTFELRYMLTDITTVNSVKVLVEGYKL